MSNIITDLSQRFRNGSISLQLIYINIGIYLLQTLVAIFLLLFNVQGGLPVHWFEMPADIMKLVVQPWSVVTYMFFHAGLLHLLFNMLWLYWFGQLFLYSFVVYSGYSSAIDLANKLMESIESEGKASSSSMCVVDFSDFNVIPTQNLFANPFLW